MTGGVVFGTDGAGRTAMPCPVCGARGAAEVFAAARDVEYFTSKDRFTYLQCGDCATVYLEHPPVDQLREIYPPSYYSYREGGGSRSTAQAVKEWLDARMLRGLLGRIPGERLRVLDVGGGSGWLLTLTRRSCDRVAETHEVDLDPQAAAIAEDAGHVFHCRPVEEFRADEPFDLILMLNILEHLADPARVLEAMRAALSPGGRILIKTPNTDTLDCRLFRHRNWGGFHCPRHFVLFTMPGLIALGERCGLRKLEARYTQGGPQWAPGMMAMLHDRGLVEIGPDRPAYTHPLYMPIQVLFAAFDFLRLPFAPTAQMLVTFGREEV